MWTIKDKDNNDYVLCAKTILSGSGDLDVFAKWDGCVQFMQDKDEGYNFHIDDLDQFIDSLLELRKMVEEYFTPKHGGWPG